MTVFVNPILLLLLHKSTEIIVTCKSARSWFEPFDYGLPSRCRQLPYRHNYCVPLFVGVDEHNCNGHVDHTGISGLEFLGRYRRAWLVDYLLCHYLTIVVRYSVHDVLWA